MRRSGALLLGILLGLTACGGGDDLAGELLGVVAVFDVAASELTLVGRDVPGEVRAADAEARLEVIEIPAGTRPAPTFEGMPAFDAPVLVVRDPLGMGSLEARLEGADRVLVLVNVLLTPTRGEVEFGARLVGLAADGRVVGADWSEAATGRLAGTLDGAPDPAGVLVRTVRALADDELGRPLDPEDRRLVEAVRG